MKQDYVYIGFSYPKHFKIGAFLLKIWQRAPFSHTYIRFEDTVYPSVVYHAAHGMVHFKSTCNFLKENQVIFEIKVPIESKILCMKDCINRAGEKYSYSELLKIFMYDICTTFGVTLKPTDSSGYICSELVGNVLSNHAGLSFKKPYFLLTPNDIYLKVKAING